MSNEKMKEKQEEIIDLVSNFCNDELNEEYKSLAIDLVKKMGEKEDVPFKRGKLEIWASAVIYALGQINSLFDKSSKDYKNPDDVCDYFNTKKSTVSRKAKVIRDMFDSVEEEFSIGNVENNASEINEDSYVEAVDNVEVVEDVSAEAADEDYLYEDEVDNQYLNYHSDYETLKEYEDAINEFKNSKGEAYFEEYKWKLWESEEARPFMQDILDYGTILWSIGQKERGIEYLEYLLELNPSDIQGVRDILINYLINLNRLEDAEMLIELYDGDVSANWAYSRLLLAIKRKENKKVIQELYDDAVNKNPHIIDYIFNKKSVDSYPTYYNLGDENEAKIYKLLSENNWNDKKTLKALRKLMKK